MSVKTFLRISTNSEQLSKRSAEAITTFHKVISDLTTINEQAAAKKQELVQKVMDAESEIVQMEIVNKSNLKIIRNIENILK